MLPTSVKPGVGTTAEQRPSEGEHQVRCVIISERYCSGGQMKVARIVAPFGLSAVVFILAYLSSRDSTSGYFPVILMGIAIALAIVGTAAVFSNK
jgi:hypothetical protein